MNVQLLMFTSPECQPCQSMKPIVERVQGAKIIDVTKEHALTQQYGIRGGLPVFIKLVNGLFYDRVDGAMSKDRLMRWYLSK